MDIKVGDIVKVTNSGKSYSAWDTAIEFLTGTKRLPNTPVSNWEYKVVKIATHAFLGQSTGLTRAYPDNKTQIALLIKGNDVCLVGIDGLEKIRSAKCCSI